LSGAVAATPRYPYAFCHRDTGYSVFIAGTAGPEVAEVEARGAAGRPHSNRGPRAAFVPNFAASADPVEIRRDPSRSVEIRRDPSTI
jgi:hypothetical protein